MCLAIQINNIFSAKESEEADDPDILFVYGKALFAVAQKNSQVLGGAGPLPETTFGINTSR